MIRFKHAFKMNVIRKIITRAFRGNPRPLGRGGCQIPLLIVSLIAFLALIFWLDDIGKQ